MDRKEFFNKLGIGAVFALTTGCFGGCTKEAFIPEGSVDFTIDLSEDTFRNLQEDGGYVIKNQVVIARDDQGHFVAATQRCSHEGTYGIILKDNEWFCTDHAARFTLNGSGLNSEGNRNLTIYKTELSSTSLRIFS